MSTFFPPVLQESVSGASNHSTSPGAQSPSSCVVIALFVSLSLSCFLSLSLFPVLFLSGSPPSPTPLPSLSFSPSHTWSWFLSVSQLLSFLPSLSFSLPRCPPSFPFFFPPSIDLSLVSCVSLTPSLSSVCLLYFLSYLFFNSFSSFLTAVSPPPSCFLILFLSLFPFFFPPLSSPHFIPLSFFHFFPLSLSVSPPSLSLSLICYTVGILEQFTVHSFQLDKITIQRVPSKTSFL